MKVSVTFSENSQKFESHFSEVHHASDGGYDRGVEEGKEQVCDYLLGGEW